MPTIAQAYVQVIPSTKGITGQLSQEFGGAGQKSGESFGSKFGSIVKKLATAAVVVKGAQAVGKLFTDSIAAGAEYEQLEGGVQKIFDEMDTSAIFADAANAYKDLNMSASDYLAIINDVGASFSATMSDEDAYKNARTGLQAIADYASGTGKDLDTLKEKFGMITRSTSSYQSIADQFSGVLPATSAQFLEQAQQAGILSEEYTKLTEVPINEYQEAVAKMLEKGTADLGLANNTAAETAGTMSGSLAGLKASWDNVLSAMAGGGDLASAISGLSESAGNVVSNLTPMLQSVFSGIVNVVGALMPQLAVLVPQLVDVLMQNLPVLIDGAVQLFLGIVDALPIIIPQIVAALPQIVKAITHGLGQAIPAIITAGIQLLAALVKGLPEVIPEMIGAMNELVLSAINGLKERGAAMIDAGKDFFLGFLEGIKQIIPNMIAKIKEFCGDMINAVKDFLGIHSPSRVMAGIGVNVGRGLADGIMSTEGLVNNSATRLAAAATHGFGGAGNWSAEPAGRNVSQININAKQLSQQDIDYVIAAANRRLGVMA